MRVRHYLKNILVFAPIFFNQTFFTEKIITASLAFFSFCLISSAVYILNDIFDAPRDRLHPAKRTRPIASGSVGSLKAGIIGSICFFFSLGFSFCWGTYSGVLVLLLYFILNVLYSAGMKNQPIVDVIILASGFILRVIYGAAMTGIPISGWLYLTIWTGAFYMGFGKRRNEIQSQLDRNEIRPVLKYYSYRFLDKNMYVCVALAIVFYAQWAVAHENPRFLWSVPLLMILLMRYSLDIEGNSDGDPIEVIMHDRVLRRLIVVFVAYLGFIIYMH